MFFEKRFAKTWIGAGLMIIIVGLVFEVLTSMSASSQDLAAAWPTVMGLVKTAEIRAISIDGGTSVARRPLLVSYVYKVGNEPFSGSQELAVSGPEDQLVAAYAVGKQVQVFYNPNAPLQSMLVPANPQADDGESLLMGPKNVLLASAVIASLPFLGIGVALRLTGQKTPVRRYSKRSNRR